MFENPEEIFTDTNFPMYCFGSQSIEEDNSFEGLSCIAEEEQSILDAVLLSQVWNKSGIYLLKSIYHLYPSFLLFGSGKIGCGKVVLDMM